MYVFLFVVLLSSTYPSTLPLTSIAIATPNPLPFSYLTKLPRLQAQPRLQEQPHLQA